MSGRHGKSSEAARVFMRNHVPLLGVPCRQLLRDLGRRKGSMVGGHRKEEEREEREGKAMVSSSTTNKQTNK